MVRDELAVVEAFCTPAGAGCQRVLACMNAAGRCG